MEKAKAKQKVKTNSLSKSNDKPKRKKNKKSKAFTLIELLAVIIILGILMIIAIPSVTSYISESRKSAYIDTAKNLVSGARTLVNTGRLGMYDTSATYYIPEKCITTEGGTKSPYGEFVQAYIGVTFDGSGYKYYWISVDSSRQGIKDITPQEKLENKLIESDLDPIEIQQKVFSTGIDGRTKVLVLQENCKEWDLKTENGTTNNDVIIYPDGKDKETVSIGEKVKIGDEEFYVVKHDGDDLILIARYNLKVGYIYDNNIVIQTGEYTSSDPGYGRQSSETRGYLSGTSTSNGTIDFSDTNYWNGKVGNGLQYPGNYCNNNYTLNNNCTYIYDSNSKLYQYVNSYKTYLQSLGATIKEARLLKVQEAAELGCGNGQNNCNNAPSWIHETTYWLGTAVDSYYIWYIGSGGVLNYNENFYTNQIGIRPVIVI